MAKYRLKYDVAKYDSVSLYGQFKAVDLSNDILFRK